VDEGLYQIDINSMVSPNLFRDLALALGDAETNSA